MKKIICFYFIILLIISPYILFGKEIQAENISSSIAVSQGGRFAIKYFTPLIIDKNISLKLTNFIAFKTNTNSEDDLILGPIPQEENIEFVCKQPTFIKNEGLNEVSILSDNNFHYFNISSNKACIRKLNKNKSLLITEIPKSFVNQTGEKVKLIAIIANTPDIALLKSNILFQVNAKDFFINLMQLSQTFSPFKNEIDWSIIQKQGLEFIGNNTASCRGLAAAAKFLIPELNKHDLHSFISLDGLGTKICPFAPIPENTDMRRWLSVPEKFRKPIIKFVSDFHGSELSNRVSYIYIPAINAYAPDDINRAVKKGRDSLTQANVNKSCGIIIDLRFNQGGSIQSMLLTLGGILPSSKLFNLGKNSPVYLSNDGNQLFIDDSKTLYGQYQGERPANNRGKPVAIITNWMTNSSGELTRLALRDNVTTAKVFGEETGPEASVNATIPLLDGNVFNLMVDRVFNNQNLKVPLRLPVDEKVKDNLEAIFYPKKDSSINAALQWLNSLSVCK